MDLIAEAGSCHDGDLQKAKSLIWTAKHAGANAVKFQYWSDSEELGRRRRLRGTNYEPYRVPLHWLDDLKTETERVGLEFLCTAYLPQDVQVVARYVQRFKVSSFEAMDVDLLDACLSYERPVLVSFGMMEWAEVENWGHEYDSDQITKLLCVSAYPCPLEDSNLCFLSNGCGGGWFHGYSDHTGNPLTGAMAVAKGAKILEVHFRLEETRPDNPDYPHSLKPSALEAYIWNVQTAERLMTPHQTKVRDSERANREHRVK